ncbi:MAG: LysR substrate-binding domain-containing protein [Actinoallomurus sp.]
MRLPVALSKQRRTEFGSVTVIHGWVRRGLGAALLPEFTVAEDLHSGVLVGHPVATPAIALRLVWRADREDAVRELPYAATGSVRDAGPVGGSGVRTAVAPSA